MCACEAIGSWTTRPVKRKSQRRAWILPCEGTRLVLYTKDNARAKMRPLYVKIMPFSLAVGRLIKEEEERENRGLADFRI